MNIAVVGTGYVGLVTGACLAETGRNVICVDVDETKIARLSRGEVPIYEPDLEPMVRRNLQQGRLRFCKDLAFAVRESSIIFIAVGTPADEDGSADLSHVLDVARQIGRSLTAPDRIIVTKSTVPVGTARRVREAIRAETKLPFHVCSNPEFLKEGAAVQDFMKPDRVVIGVDSEYAKDALSDLYAPFVRTGRPILFMDLASAEITKYAANAMLATRISFMNMIAQLCSEVGADVESVRKGVGSDMRIGSSFLFPGIGFGGSCFPKDVSALIRTLDSLGVDASILRGVEHVNQLQRENFVQAVVNRFGEDLSGRQFGIWGLSFKPGTDDMREAPSTYVIPEILRRGGSLRVHDPAAMGVARSLFGNRVTYCERQNQVLDGSSALLILTEWHPYRQPDFSLIQKQLEEQVIFDGRNLFDPAKMRSLGFEYYSMGRPCMLPLKVLPASDAAD